MPKKPSPKRRVLPSGEAIFAPAARKPVPHAFVLDELASLDPVTRPMFGCTAVYVEDKIVLILRDKPAPSSDNGVWLATTEEHHASLRAEFPNMQSISVLGAGVTGWQMLPADAPDFEEAALRACELVRARDPRIGKVPGARAKVAKKVSEKKAAKEVSPAQKGAAGSSPQILTPRGARHR